MEFEKKNRKGPEPADISWINRKELDIAYGSESSSQVMDLYFPEEGEGPFPLLMNIHGGGFSTGGKRDDHIEPFLKFFLNNGFAYCSIQYRMSREAIFPAAVLDCREAVRFLKRRSTFYYIDPYRISVIGDSAGGNLAALLAMNIPNGGFLGEESRAFSEDCSVFAAIDQFGPLDFMQMDDMARGNGISLVMHNAPDSPESLYMGGELQTLDPTYVEKANPASYINEQMAPILVQHGCMDELVPYQQSVEFVETVRKRIGQDRVEFTTFETAAHEDEQFFTVENLREILTFINR